MVRGPHEAILAALLAAIACNLGEGIDAGLGDEDEGPASDSGDAELDGLDAAAEGPPPTVVATGGEVTTARLCDLDGDGQLDNALADLGEPHASLLAAAVDAVFLPELDEGNAIVLHAPGIARAGPDAQSITVMTLEGVPVEAGLDPDEGAYYATSNVVDACLEPRIYSEEAVVDEGVLRVGATDLVLPLDGRQIYLRDGQVTTVFAPDGTAEMSICANLPVGDAAAFRARIFDASSFSDSTLLEVLVAGGAILGLGTVPGVEPDLDLDGDGLERLELDDDLRMDQCIDGDGTVIAGRDCALDERMADGFSLNIVLQAARARLDGPEPWLQHLLREECDSLPPEPSLWGSCTAAEPVCERFELRSCEARCGAGTELCRWDCGGYLPCLPEASARATLTSCANALVSDHASCAGEADPTVTLVDAPYQRAGVQLGEPVPVGMGLLVAEAQTTVARSSGAPPRELWALVVVPAAESPDDFGWEGPSYVAYWWPTNGAEGGEADTVGLWVNGLESPPTFGSHAVLDPAQRLDSTTEGEVVQRLRVVVGPDLPETAEDELFVRVDLWQPEGWQKTGVGCFGGECPFPIAAGDELRVGVQAATGDAPFLAELRGADALTVESRGLCP